MSYTTINPPSAGEYINDSEKALNIVVLKDKVSNYNKISIQYSYFNLETQIESIEINDNINGNSWIIDNTTEINDIVSGSVKTIYDNEGDNKQLRYQFSGVFEKVGWDGYYYKGLINRNEILESYTSGYSYTASEGEDYHLSQWEPLPFQINNDFSINKNFILGYQLTEKSSMTKYGIGPNKGLVYPNQKYIDWHISKKSGVVSGRSLLINNGKVEPNLGYIYETEFNNINEPYTLVIKNNRPEHEGSDNFRYLYDTQETKGSIGPDFFNTILYWAAYNIEWNMHLQLNGSNIELKQDYFPSFRESHNAWHRWRRTTDFNIWKPLYSDFLLKYIKIKKQTYCNQVDLYVPLYKQNYEVIINFSTNNEFIYDSNQSSGNIIFSDSSSPVINTISIKIHNNQVSNVVMS